MLPVSEKVIDQLNVADDFGHSQMEYSALVGISRLHSIRHAFIILLGQFEPDSALTDDLTNADPIGPDLIEIPRGPALVGSVAAY